MEESSAESSAAAPFQLALGRQLRKIREANRETAAEVASTASNMCGLPWTRVTVTRTELGQRPVSAAELLLLPAIYGAPLSELIPQEAVEFTDKVSVPAGGLRELLLDDVFPYTMDASFMVEALDGLKSVMGRLSSEVRSSYPGVSAMNVARAAREAREEPVIKAARRLGVEPLDVAVAAKVMWTHGLLEERDRRLGDEEADARTRQARRGHITRQLISEITPIINKLHATREDGPDGQPQ